MKYPSHLYDSKNTHNSTDLRLEWCHCGQSGCRDWCGLDMTPPTAAEQTSEFDPASGCPSLGFAGPPARTRPGPIGVLWMPELLGLGGPLGEGRCGENISHVWRPIITTTRTYLNTTAMPKVNPEVACECTAYRRRDNLLHSLEHWRTIFIFRITFISPQW